MNKTMLSNSSLQIDRVDKAFGTQTVVNNLNLTLIPGTVTCLLGSSGCGKSTTLRIAAGLEQQDRGKVFVDGRLMSSDHNCYVPPENRGIGFMFQDFALFPHLTVEDNIKFGIPNRSKKRTKSLTCSSLLERIGLAGFQHKYPHMLSGGEQQRVALARALASMPSIMLMDEPFSGLDKKLRDQVREQTMNLMREEGTSVLIVTHEPEEAMKLADSIALMRNGTIVQQGAPYNIYNKPIDSKAAAFFSDINILRSTVENGRTTTAFGPFLTPGFPEGSEVEIIIRPQHFKIDFDRNGNGPSPSQENGVPARGIVHTSRFLGKESLVELIMEADSSKLQASIAGVFLPRSGTFLWLSIRRDRCFVFLKS